MNITCSLKDEIKQAWQQEVYSAIENEYERLFEEYEAEAEIKKSEEEASKEEPVEEIVSNAMARQIIERELKRLCIEMMVRPFCISIGSYFYENREACEYPIPQIQQTADYQNYLDLSKFFEDAFDWQLMSYTLFSYFWGFECRWAKLLQAKNLNDLLQAFANAGMAKVLLPIKCQYGVAVAYFLETGQILKSQDIVIDDTSGKYLSLFEELKNCDSEIEVEGSWETREPSRLTILQKDSALIDEEGLPCCDVVSDSEYENTLIAHREQLKSVENIE